MKNSELKITASDVLVKIVKQFIEEPTKELDELILKFLASEMALADFEAPEDMFVEWQSTEHNVVHVGAYEGQQWIEINPVTKEIVAL